MNCAVRHTAVDNAVQQLELAVNHHILNCSSVLVDSYSHTIIATVEYFNTVFTN
jgi:hypothetical protein